MRAASLLLVFLLAKTCVLAGHTIPISPWTPLAYVWQDVLVALLFGLLELAVEQVTTRTTAAYWILCAYAAINIPVGRAVSTPLTWPMLRAARGPLADSILLYATATNALLVALTLTAAAILPMLFRRLSRRWLAIAALAAVPIVLLGPMATARVDTVGLDRNPLVALATSAFPRVSVSQSGSGDNWRTSRFTQKPVEDLTDLRGIAAGNNVVVVSMESAAAQYLSLYGSNLQTTPQLDALARHAIVFDNAYAVYPESIKGLASVLCSIFPAFDSKPEQYENIPCRTVASILSDTGYRTALFHSGRFAYLGMESVIRNRGYQTLHDAGDIGGNHESSFGVDEPAAVAKSLQWIDSLPRGQRFFLTYLPIAGHHPYETPQRGPFPDRDEIGRYRNALHYGDAALGTLADGLRQRGLLDNTLWIIYGDHGEAFGQHDGNFGHTFFLYDENIRVPLVIVSPGAIRNQHRVKKIVSLVDIAPTILDLLGIPAPHSDQTAYQGASMLDNTPRMALFFTDYSLGLLGLRDGDWKFIYEIEPRRSKLFQMERDPQETADLATSQAERSAWYLQMVRDWSGNVKKRLERAPN